MNYFNIKIYIVNNTGNFIQNNGNFRMNSFINSKILNKKTVQNKENYGFMLTIIPPHCC